MEIKYYGHSCFSIRVSGCVLLFDPFIRGNELANAIDINSIQADYILVSHGHEDHTGDLIFVAQKTGAKVVGSFELTNWCAKHGIKNTHPMNVGGKWNFDFGKVTMTYASHSSSFGDGSYAGVAAGFVIEANNKTVYYSGDTALNLDMKLIGSRHKIDWALLPIGDNFTMGSEEAAEAANYLNCQQVIGLHYDTFGYIVVDHEKAVADFKEKHIQLTLLKIGEHLAI